MAKPLRSENPQPQDIQFKHFGVLNTGGQSKTSLFTSITVNVLLALIIVVIGLAAKKVVIDNRTKEAVFVPIKEKPPEPKPIKPPPPPKIPPPPPKPTIEPPKILEPKVKIPDPPKPVVVKDIPKPVPVIVAVAPKVVQAMAAPKVVSVKLPAQAAAVVNHDTTPSPVKLGHTDSLIADSKTPATMAVNLGGKGQPNMSSANTGHGPPTQVNLGGNGGPSGTAVKGGGVVAIAGLGNGRTGGTGNGPGNGTKPQVAQVAMGHAPVPVAQTTTIAKATVKSPPVVTYKPTPVYTEEARAQHIEGRVLVHIRVTAAGVVQVIGVTSGLGHGLDASALQVCQGMHFKPAVDSNGTPVDWEGNVTVSFQLA